MRRASRSQAITHSLAHTPALCPPSITDYQEPSIDTKYNPLYTKNTFANPLTQRSRKHRLLEEKNTDIERENRRLFEKLRRIKLKNAFQSETKLDIVAPLPEDTLFSNEAQKPCFLPQVNSHAHSLNTTKSELNSILTDRKTFVSKYFEELGHLRNIAPRKTEELGNFLCNGWKVRVLLVDEEFVLLRGRQGVKELTKKYKWEKVKDKMAGGLENWVKFKFEFED